MSGFVTITQPAFRTHIRDHTAEGKELSDYVLSEFCDENASIKERMDAATWLADRGFGKPAPVRDNDAPGIGDFPIVINDHQDDANPMIEP